MASLALAAIDTCWFRTDNIWRGTNWMQNWWYVEAKPEDALRQIILRQTRPCGQNSKHLEAKEVMLLGKSWRHAEVELWSDLEMFQLDAHVLLDLVHGEWNFWERKRKMVFNVATIYKQKSKRRQHSDTNAMYFTKEESATNFCCAFFRSSLHAM